MSAADCFQNVDVARFRQAVADLHEIVGTAKGRIEVSEQTEQRASNKHEWKPAFDIDRPERAKEMLAKLVEAMKK